MRSSSQAVEIWFSMKSGEVIIWIMYSVVVRISPRMLSSLSAIIMFLRADSRFSLKAKGSRVDRVAIARTSGLSLVFTVWPNS